MVASELEELSLTTVTEDKINKKSAEYFPALLSERTSMLVSVCRC